MAEALAIGAGGFYEARENIPLLLLPKRAVQQRVWP
jgi:hypothetical protein